MPRTSMARGWDSADTGTPRELPWRERGVYRRSAGLGRGLSSDRSMNIKQAAGRSSDPEPPPDGLAGHRQDVRVVAERERAVRVVEDRVEVEQQRLDVLVRGQVAGGTRGLQLAGDPSLPAAVELGDPILHRTWLGVDLGRSAGEEAAAGKDLVAEVVDEGVGQGEERR